MQTDLPTTNGQKHSTGNTLEETAKVLSQGKTHDIHSVWCLCASACDIITFILHTFMHPRFKPSDQPAPIVPPESVTSWAHILIVAYAFFRIWHTIICVGDSKKYQQQKQSQPPPTPPSSLFTLTYMLHSEKIYRVLEQHNAGASFDSTEDCLFIVLQQNAIYLSPLLLEQKLVHTDLFGGNFKSYKDIWNHPLWPRSISFCPPSVCMLLLILL